MTFLANAWPGWITSSATLVTYIFDGGNVKLLAILGLAAIAIALTMVWSVLLFGVASVIAIYGQWDNIKDLLGLG
jgi:hypothetical protein